MTTTDSDLETELIKMIREMKVAINSYKTEEYEILSVKFRNKMENYFLNDTTKPKF